MPRKVLITKETLEEILAKYQGGGSGTVEAEPIISIKMTNMDLRTADDSPDADLNNVQLYCTKETWNNMVAYAKQLDSSLDITYANFGTIYASMSAANQQGLIGFLMNDYINGKILPNAYAEDIDAFAVPGIHGQGLLQRTTTLQSANTNNIKVVVVGYFANNTMFPSVDRANIPYTTANTVITVEEIDGPVIGASGGSGTSDALYKHTITGLIAEPDTPETDPEQVTPYIQVSGGSGSSVELPKYYEVLIYVSSQNSGGTEKMLFNITESNLNILIDEANQQLSSFGYTLTKDNWSTLIPQLGTASNQLRHALIRGLLTLSVNASAEDIDGYSNMIYVSATGTIKIGYDPDDYTEVVRSSVTPISNHF